LRRLAAPWGLGGRGRVRRHTATSGRHQLRGVAGGRVAGDRDDRIVDHRHPPQSDQSGHWVRTARERNLSLRVDPESPRTVPGRDGSPPGRVRRHLRHGHRALPYQSRVRQPRFRAPDPAEGTVILAALLTVPAAAGGLALLAPQIAARRAILVAAAFAHLSLVAALWLRPVALDSRAWIGVDSLGLLVLSLLSLTFAAVACYAIGYLPRQRPRAGRAFVGCLLLLL